MLGGAGSGFRLGLGDVLNASAGRHLCIIRLPPNVRNKLCTAGVGSRAGGEQEKKEVEVEVGQRIQQ